MTSSLNLAIQAREIAGRHARVAIVGAPETGKTTLANHLGVPVTYHTDDTMNQPWGDQPALYIDACRGVSRFVIEGVQVARCLRKGLEVDAVIVLSEPKKPQSIGQKAMGKAVHSVFEEWRAAHPRVPVYWLEV
jgi:hypothetical protein